MKTCETCMFYRGFGKNDLGNTIEVRNLVMDDDDEIMLEQIATGTCHIRSVPQHVFPMRHKDQSCGEHQPKEESDVCGK